MTLDSSAQAKKVNFSIKCFCNDDDSLCSKPSLSSTSFSSFKLTQLNNDLISKALGSENLALNKKLGDFLTKTGQEFRYCISNTICMTKRFISSSTNQTYLKHYCDHHTPNSNNIRVSVIEYRDCKINTNVEADRAYIMQHMSEFCCNDNDFCNIDLNPKEYVRELREFVVKNTNNLLPNNEIGSTVVRDASAGEHQMLLTPANIILISIFSLIFMLLIVIGLFCLYSSRKTNLNKTKKSAKKSKMSSNKKDIIYKSVFSNSNSSSSSSSTTSTKNSNLINLESKDKDPMIIMMSQHNNAAAPQESSSQMYTQSTLYSYSTTNTSLNSKENSVSNHHTHLNKIYNIPSKMVHKSPELYEPFLGTTTSEDTDAIKISSPLQSTTQSILNQTSTGANQTIADLSQLMNDAGQNAGEFEWSGSGSGAGVPQCVQRTIARQIKLMYPCIGKGRFGEVYRGEWRGENVAVKTFSSADEQSWVNECEIYSTTGFRHESILGFIAADNIDRGVHTELWIVTEFHSNGSLFDYLTVNKIQPQQAMTMLLSIVNGLVHLHMPIECYKGKPALAHCDLKSKNILVKQNLTCCIADLGLALRGDKDGRIALTNNSSYIRTGTKRYLAPEILNKTIDMRYLDSFQKAEIYSLSLIIWELLRACKFESQQTKITYSYEYKLPYFEHIPIGDPDDSLMRQIVCEKKLRPSIVQFWHEHPIMHEMTKLCEDLWVETPNERLTALRIKKSIIKFLEQNNNNNS
jgi:TGF-beta receptor type-1